MEAELKLPELMGYIAEELILWLKEPEMGAGVTSGGAALELRGGIHWNKSRIIAQT